MSHPQPEPHRDPSTGHSGPADGQQLVVPGTGEILSLNAPTDMLADFVLRARETERGLRKLREQIEGELRERMQASERALLQAGEFEVRVPERNDAVWDADELEAVLRDLIDEGALHAAETVGVIAHETKVSKSAASRLAKRLRGAARQRVEACRHWQKSYGSVEVTRSQPLIPPELEAELEEAQR